MRIFKKIAVLAVAAALVLASLVPAAPALAAQQKATEKAVNTAYLYSYYTVHGADLTINGKAYNKLPKALKKTVSVKVYMTNKRGFSYVASAYTSANSPAYKYIKTNGYSLFFKKAGTYTLKYKTYDKVYPAERDFIDGGEESSGASYYYMKTLDYATGWTTDTEVKYYLKTDANGVEYYTDSYEGAGTKVFARGQEWYSWIPATLTDDVLTFKPMDYKVTTHTLKLVVKNTDAIITSVKLGKASNTYSDQEFEGGYSYTRTVKPFLSGKSGKVVVTPAKGIKIMDIVIQTYDKNGKPVYKLVKNKKKVTFGQYKYKDSYQSEYSNYRSTDTSLFKNTRVYVFYKDSATGGYTDITKIKKNADGEYVFTYNYRPNSAQPVQKKQTTVGYVPDYYWNSYTFFKK